MEGILRLISQVLYCVDEYLNDEGLTVIEWSQFSPDLVPEEHLKISIQLLENGDREFTFYAIGKQYEDLLGVLA